MPLRRNRISTASARPRSAAKAASESDLNRLAKEGNHTRHETLLTAINVLAIILIYLFVFGIIVWLVVLSVHYAQTNDWTSFERRGDLLAVALVSYLISYLQTNGIRGKA